MDDQYVDVYFDSRAQAYTYMRNGSLAEAVKLNRSPERARPHPATCAHGALQEVFAHARDADVHWPMAYCDDCLTIVHGREPLALRDASGAGGDPFENLIAKKWAKDWPAPGKPHAKRPPAGTTWPKGA
jgi:hypothetical protein